MKRAWWWGIGIGVVLLGVVAVGTCVAVFSAGNMKPWTGHFGGAVGILELSGPIGRADEFLRKIEHARKSKRVKAVVLRVNSPGGSVGASQEIYHALRRLAKDKPLVASFGTVAASGGFYAGIAAQEIFALPGTVTASIGVRMSHIDATQLMEWAGIQPDVLKTGKFKAIGAMYRPMQPDERQLLDDLLQTMHGQFKAAIAESRKIDLATIDTFADGRIMTGDEALQRGLIDAIGDLHDAVNAAAKRAGMKPDPKVIRFTNVQPWWVDFLRGEAITQLTQKLHQPVFGYYWVP